MSTNPIPPNEQPAWARQMEANQQPDFEPLGAHQPNEIPKAEVVPNVPKAAPNYASGHYHKPYKKHHHYSHRSHRDQGGGWIVMALVLAGVAYFSGWTFSWWWMFWLIPLFFGMKKSIFRGGWSPLILIGMGLYLLTNVALPTWLIPAALIGLGLWLLFKPRKESAAPSQWV